MRRFTSRILAALALLTLVTPLASAKEVAIGKPAPDFKATNIEGKEVKLSDWIGKKQLVVVFSRAHWCPFCMGQLKDLAKHQKAIHEHDAEIIIVFREEKDGPDGLLKSQQISGAKFPLLLDLDKKSSGDYSTTGFTTYIIGKNGNVKEILAGTKPKRPKSEAILKALHD